MNKADGWSKYKKLTSNNNGLENINSDESENPNDLVKKFNKILTKSKFQAFGKAKVGGVPKVNKELRELELKKVAITKENPKDHKSIDKLDDEIRIKLHDQQRAKFQKEIEDLKNLKFNKGRILISRQKW